MLTYRMRLAILTPVRSKPLPEWKNVHRSHYYAVYLQLSDFTAHPTHLRSSFTRRMLPQHIKTMSYKAGKKEALPCKSRDILPYHFQGMTGQRCEGDILDKYANKALENRPNSFQNRIVSLAGSPRCETKHSQAQATNQPRTKVSRDLFKAPHSGGQKKLKISLT